VPVALHQHNEHFRTEKLLQDVLARNQTLALITDAGTPGISDPGFLAVKFAVQMGIVVEVLPGPAALIPALVASGLPADRFVFEGFLPVKKGRATRLSFLKDESRTLIFYESPHRILKTLAQFIETFGAERQAAIARELTKVHEEVLRGTLAELHHHFETHVPKGEFVVLVAGRE
jgi:16S rRNA (cytidine1402-2'-O)-methyltransferase